MTTAIKFENISKQYRLGLVSTRTISHDLNRWWQVSVRGKEDPYLKIGEVNDRATKGISEYVWALRDISFEVEQGDVMGIIGKNGAGKSTLLKILSKVTTPTTGSIKARGRIASLLEVGTGFHGEMTGRENIFLNGAILGMSKQEINRKLDEIVDFSGVERYLDTPTKRYSSGMTVRLGFAVAAFLEPEILVVDEVLAVGDAEFQKKAIGKMQDVSRGEGRTVLFVSHNMGAIKNLCQQGVLLKDGEVNKIGNIDAVVEAYLSQTTDSPTYVRTKSKSSIAYLKTASVTDQSGKVQSNFLHTDSIFVDLRIVMKEQVEGTKILVIVQDPLGKRLCGAETLVNNQEKFRLELIPPFLARGNYALAVYLYKPAVAAFDYQIGICPFTVIDGGSHFAHLETFDYGTVFVNHKWL